MYYKISDIIMAHMWNSWDTLLDSINYGIEESFAMMILTNYNKI